MMRFFAGLSVLLLWGQGPAAAEQAKLALIIGVNRSVDADAPPLRYADDDAAEYLSLFRTLGAHAYALASFDDNTARLHPQAVAEAHPPRRRELERAVAALAADVAQARSRHVETVLYFVYAGHGNVHDGEGYLALEDARLDVATLAREVVDRVGADETHMIVDACYSSFLVLGRGPGGERRPFAGFSRLSALANRPEIGLVLSTSSGRESHEWEAIQAGVFSHEVRSGLYGPADADGDGVISYREIAAFVDRANASIANERFRPDVFARPPERSGELVDLRGRARPRIDVDGTRQGHVFIEDARGVRWVELNRAGPVQLLRPDVPGTLYLRRVDGEEYVLPDEDVVDVAALTPEGARVQRRGAAQDAFRAIFSEPLSAADVARYLLRPLPEPYDAAPQRRRRRRVIGYGVLGGAGASLLSGVALTIAGAELRKVPDGTSQLEVIERNQLIRRTEIASAVLYGGGGALALAGALLALVPETKHRVRAGVSAVGASLSYEVSF